MSDDDYDIGEIFAARREEGKLRKASNRCTSTVLLESHNVHFEVKNDGHHLICRFGGKTADFWPGTGKYGIRTGSSKPVLYRRGVFNLLRDLGVKR